MEGKIGDDDLRWLSEDQSRAAKVWKHLEDSERRRWVKLDLPKPADAGATVVGAGMDTTTVASTRVSLPAPSPDKVTIRTRIWLQRLQDVPIEDGLYARIARKVVTLAREKGVRVTAPRDIEVTEVLFIEGGHLWGKGSSGTTPRIDITMVVEKHLAGRILAILHKLTNGEWYDVLGLPSDKKPLGFVQPYILTQDDAPEPRPDAGYDSNATRDSMGYAFATQPNADEHGALADSYESGRVFEDKGGDEDESACPGGVCGLKPKDSPANKGKGKNSVATLPVARVIGVGKSSPATMYEVLILETQTVVEVPVCCCVPLLVGYEVECVDGRWYKISALYEDACALVLRGHPNEPPKRTPFEELVSVLFHF